MAIFLDLYVFSLIHQNLDTSFGEPKIGPQNRTNIEKLKIVFKIRKYYLQIIFFLMVIKDLCFKDTLKALNNFKKKQKSVWSNAFWSVKVCIFWKCIQYTIHWDKTQLLKKTSFGHNKQYRIFLFFLLQAPTYHSFTFNLQFLHELKHKVRLSKTVCWIFHFWFHFTFMKVYIFVQQNAWTLFFDFKIS